MVNVGANSAIEHPSVRGCLKFMGMDEGVEIHHVAYLPARAGLGTSSAFTVSWNCHLPLMDARGIR